MGFNARCALYPIIFKGENRGYTSNVITEDRFFSNFKETLQMGNTFFFTMISWVFFRSENINSAFNYLLKMITEIALPSDNRSGIICVIILVMFDWILLKNEKKFFYS